MTALNTDSRALATALHRAAVEGAAPFARTAAAVASWLAAHPSRHGATHVLALGKAASAMCAGACHALQERDEPIASGLIITSHVTDASLASYIPPVVDAVIGDHPVPGPNSLAAADALDDAVLRVDAGDTVVVLISGGTTSLAAAPTAALSQQVGDVARAQAHVANLADTLLESGLAIHEMNAIRRRVLRWSAGRLAVALHQRGAAHIAVFAISDVIGDDPATVGSGPCSPEPLDDASFLSLFDAHDLRPHLEREMAQYLGLVGAGTPPVVASADHAAFQHVSYQFVARNRDAVHAMADAARRAGFEHVGIEETPLSGDAAQLGDEIARRALHHARALPRDERSIWIAGGEPVVDLRAATALALGGSDDEPALDEVALDEPQRGGRMQALALAAALRLESQSRDSDNSAWRITMLAAGTDGRDGPTDATGAIVDCAVPLLARRNGNRNPDRDLATGRSWFSLDAANALLRTGPTGTNVMDVVAVIIDRRPAN